MKPIIIPSQTYHKNIQEEIGYNLFDLISEHGGYLAGGAVRAHFADEEVSDYDIFFESERGLNQVLKKLLKEEGDEELLFSIDEELLLSIVVEDEYSEHYSLKFCSSNAVSIIHKKNNIEIQLIKGDGRFKKVEEQIFSFDFSICSAGYDFEKSQFVLHPLFFDDLKSKRIRIVQDEKDMLYPLAEVERIARYSRKGYNIRGIDIVYVILFIAERMKKIKTYDDFRREINGMDIVLIDGVLEESEIKGDDKFDSMDLFSRIYEYVENKESDQDE